MGAKAPLKETESKKVIITPKRERNERNKQRRISNRQKIKRQKV